MLIKLKNSRVTTDLSNPLPPLESILFPSLDLLKTIEPEANLTVFGTVIDKTQVNSETLQSSINQLSKQAELRKENQLVYGKSLCNYHLVGLGLGLADNPNKPDCVFYKEKLKSTESYRYCDDRYTFDGVVEFGLTYDNKIFIVPKYDNVITNNLYKMAQGAFLKAVGCMQIGNREVEEGEKEETYSKILEGQVKYISVYNSFFDVQKDNIAISLFALKQLGVDLDDTQVVVPNDKDPLISRSSGCHITIKGNVEKASYYLDESRFPGAKVLAAKKSNFSDKIFELFCAVDDEILSKKNKKFIKDSYGEKQLLKLSLIRLFSCTEALKQASENNSKPVEVQPGVPNDINQPSTSLQAITEQISVSETITEKTAIDTFNNSWQGVKESLLFFKEKNMDLNFLVYEIITMLAYLLQNGLTSKEKDQLKEWTIPEKIPGRGLDPEAIPDYIQFYDQNPIKTCLALLHFYSKGCGWQGMISRFFSGAWKRNYKESVNKFLMIYTDNELPDNTNICGIYQGLKDSGLIFNYDAENNSSLRKILLFCAKLNGEESSLLYMINTLSITSFPSIESTNCQSDCCY